MNADIKLKKIFAIMAKLKEEGFLMGIGNVFQKRIVEYYYSVVISTERDAVFFNIHELRWGYLENGEKTILPGISIKYTVSKDETIDNFYYLYIQKNMDFEEIAERAKRESLDGDN